MKHEPLNRSLEGGAALLEMLLFTPLALLFLFAAIDFALTLQEKAALTDAVRSGMNAHAHSSHLGEVVGYDMIDIDSETIAMFLHDVTTAVGENILNARHQEGTTGKDVRVQAALFEATIDPSSGALLDLNRRGRSAAFPAALQTENASGNATSCDSYARQVLRDANVAKRSLYALPLSRVYERDGNARELRYLPRTMLLCAEAVTSPRALSLNLTSVLLGTKFTLNEILMLPLRFQLS